MGKRLAKVAYFAFPFLLVFIATAKGRSLRYNSPTELLSDGVHDTPRGQYSLISFKGIDFSEKCEQMYGFLPCSYSPLGHLFLIVVYEYLLFHGESYVASGGELIFKILGPGVFGASAFQIIGALPESLILLGSGLMSSKETAQEYVLMGVGLLAGSTILLLTVLWGICVLVGSREFNNNNSQSSSSIASNPIQNSFQKMLSSLNGYGINTDVETSYIAGIMVLSVIPFVVIQIPNIFNLSSSYEESIVIIFTLIVSLVFLLLFFFYQIFQPWIQKRRLEYVKHEYLVLDILKHVQKHTLARLLTDNGAPNVLALRRLFEEIDQDCDNFLSFSELKQLLLEIKFRKSNWGKDKTIADVMKEFDLDGDNKITMDEFINGFTKWLDETKRALDKRFLSRKSLEDIYQILQPWVQKKRADHELKKNLISKILRHVESYALGSFYKEDGTPDLAAIKRLFKHIDHDKDDHISEAELKELIVDIKFGKLPLDVDEAVSKIMEDLDASGDNLISEEEFVTGLEKWLIKLSYRTLSFKKESEDDTYERSWEEADMLIEDRGVDRSAWVWTKAIMLLLIGVGTLAILAEPLIHSVQKLSKSANIPSFFVSFILVPLATNARVATSAIKATSHKKPRTTSLTFSEIYGGVFMNNILGFSVLLSIIYFRGLSWEFSAHVFVVLIVCGIMGLTASFRSILPIWTSFLAFLLYPLSLLLVHVLDDIFKWS